MKRIGIDIGSHSIGCVLLEDNEIADVQYREHRGDIARELQAVLSKPEYASYNSIGV
jgi:activator of 2-hydroxyglutaryl-CoA dehydratase